LRATRVSFTPGARTAWHTHPVGQVLYVLSGVGHVQCEPEPAVILQPGDTVLIPPGVRHWHGAAPENLFVHLAMSETTDQGEATTWFEHVTDADYRQATKAAS
jgi:quercetin dioxygenase-like cupin family protein